MYAPAPLATTSDSDAYRVTSNSWIDSIDALTANATSAILSGGTPASCRATA
jgi:hypothetical protein